VVKRKSLFDDRPDEIQQLTYIVKQHIDALNAGIGTAPQRPRSASARGSLGS